MRTRAKMKFVANDRARRENSANAEFFVLMSIYCTFISIISVGCMIIAKEYRMNLMIENVVCNVKDSMTSWYQLMEKYPDFQFF